MHSPSHLGEIEENQEPAVSSYEIKKEKLMQDENIQILNKE